MISLLDSASSSLDATVRVKVKKEMWAAKWQTPGEEILDRLLYRVKHDLMLSQLEPTRRKLQPAL
jgi:hypothetical protein